MPRSPQWMDLYQIWFRGSPRGHNQMCGILLQSAHGFRFCEGSKFAVSKLTWPVAINTVLALPRSQWRSQREGVGGSTPPIRIEAVFSQP